MVWKAFSLLAGIGLMLSAAVHVGSLAGVALFGRMAFALHVGIFVVWLPAILSSRARTRGLKGKAVWDALLRGCPSWMRGVVFVLGPYALLNFALSMLGPGGVAAKHATASDAAALRAFSGHWMAFYSVAASVLYASGRAGRF